MLTCMLAASSSQVAVLPDDGPVASKSDETWSATVAEACSYAACDISFPFEYEETSRKCCNGA